MGKKLIAALCLASCLLSCLEAKATDVRVALVQGQKTISLRAEDDFKAVDLGSGEEQLLPKGRYFARIQDDKIFLENRSFGKNVELRAVEGKRLPMLNSRNYDGSLRLRLVDNQLIAVNTLDVEKLLHRTLPAKTMPIWPDEAIKAQAVAARTYVLHQCQQQAGKNYDVTALDAEISYSGLGARADKPVITKLIRETKGQYVADSYGRPIYALTTSSSGGRTEESEVALGKSYSYLRSVEDNDQDSPEYKWDFRISPDYISSCLEQNGFKLGKLLNIRLSSFKEPGGDRTTSGRVRYLILGGDQGTVKISGQRFSEIFNLNSNYFELVTGTPAPEKIDVPIENRYGMLIGKKEIPIKVREKEPEIWNKYMKSYHVLTGGKDEKVIFHGRGKGKGLGLSAWGARAMAGGEEPKSYEQILAYYYPGTHLVK